jgi:hypothetical protein
LLNEYGMAPRLARALLLAVILAPSVAVAEPVAVKFTEGVVRAFPTLRAADTGERLASGDLAQYVDGDRVVSRLTFRFRDGSLYDETVVFSQKKVFTLQSYRIVQRGPSFPESLDATVDRETERYEVQYRADADSPEEILHGKITLPEDAYNGMLSLVLKNLTGQRAETVQVMTFTPKPRLVAMRLQPIAQEMMQISEQSLPTTRYQVRPDLGLFASLLVVDLPDIKCWIVGGEVPTFAKFEGPLYFMGPVWRIDTY